MNGSENQQITANREDMTTPEYSPQHQQSGPPHPGYGYPPQHYPAQQPPHAQTYEHGYGQPYPPQPYPPTHHAGYYPHHPNAAAAQQAPLFRMRLIEHTGMVFMFSQRSYVVVGTLEQCESYYQRAQTHCLGAGWWSLASIIALNWFALYSNRRTIKATRARASQLMQQ